MAIRQLNETLALNPKDVRSLYHLGDIYLSQMKDPAKGFSYLQQVLLIDPDHSYAKKARQIMAKQRGTPVDR